MNRNGNGIGSNGSSIRTFVAIEFPDFIRSFLRELQERLKKTLTTKASWPDPSTMHLTLAFLGDVPLSRIPGIQQLMTTAIHDYRQAFPQEPANQEQSQSVLLSLGGLGFFPSTKNIRVLWTGVRGQTDRIEKLYSLLADQMAAAGFKTEKRRFAPHITLGRMKYPAPGNQIIPVLNNYADRVSDDFFVDSIVLFKSRLTSSGAIHTKLFSEKI